MKVLQNIIGRMNKEEIRHFKIFINRTKAGGEDRKDALLFDYMHKTFPDYQEEKILQKLYPREEKNSLYRLKNRLLDDISKSFLLQYHGHNDVNYIMNQIALARLFQHKGQAKTAYYYLTRAAKKTNEIESFELLELIYNEFIKLSHETLDINPEAYILKRKENRIKLNQLQEIDDILAAVTYRLKISQNYSKQNNKILEMLQKTVNDFSNSKDMDKNPQLRFKIYHAVSQILLQKHDYISLEKYLLSTFKDFSKKKLFNKINHNTKLQMLVYIINSLFKNRKIDLSLEYVHELKKAMAEYGNYLHDKYLFYYYNSLVINYSKKDLQKAISILNEAKENPIINKLPTSIVFIYANLATLSFDKKDYKASLKNLVKLQMHENFKNLDEALRYKIAIAELIIRYELNDFDYVEHKIERIKKDFGSLYNHEDYRRAKKIMDIILEMINSPTIKQNKELIGKIMELITSGSSDEEAENDIINYNDWLRSKI